MGVCATCVGCNAPAPHAVASPIRTSAPLIAFGASPRATIYLTLAAKAHAFVKGRGYATPEDVKSIAFDVLRHRVLLTYEAEAEDVTPEAIVQRVLDTIEVP